VEFSVRVARQNYHSVLSNSKELLSLIMFRIHTVIEGDKPYKEEKQHALHTTTVLSI